MTLVPLFCAKFINLHEQHGENAGGEHKRVLFRGIVDRFNIYFQRLLDRYEMLVTRTMKRPGLTAGLLLGGTALILIAFTPILGRSYFPRTDPGQFIINVKMPSGTRIETSDAYIAQVEHQIRQVVAPHDLGMIVSNIGITPDLSAIYTPNASMDTAFVQVSLADDHSTGSYQYIDRVRRRLASEMPEIQTYFQAGGLVDSVMNQGLPAPIDIQISSNNQNAAFAEAKDIAQRLHGLSSVGDAYIPQDLKYPGLQLNIDRERASLIGLSPKDVVDNVITALTSNGVIAPSYWIDPNTGNNYMLTVQYSTHQLEHMNMEEFENIPLRGRGQTAYTPLRSVAFTKPIDTPTEVDHYALRRVIDIYVQPRLEALNTVSRQVNHALGGIQRPRGMRITVRGALRSMTDSFGRFGIGLLLAIGLIYLVLMAQFGSFLDPFIILMAIPPGLAGVVLILLLTGSTLNIMSLMGVIMMTGIVVSNSILIVEFAGILHAQGHTLLEAVVQSCKIRMRPILMTSLATLLGMIPLALGLEAGSEQYAPLARALIGGLAVSVVVTMFLVPAVYLLVHSRRDDHAPTPVVEAA
jgi:multidrug efflux pump subunit AcrB